MLKLEGWPQWAVHAVCGLVVVLGFIAAFTVLKGVPLGQYLVIAFSFWVWGTLGFKPAEPIYQKMIAQLSMEDLLRIKSLHPPPPQPATEAVNVGAPPSRVIEPLPDDIATDRIPIAPFPTRDDDESRG